MQMMAHASNEEEDIIGLENLGKGRKFELAEGRREN